MQNFKYDGNKYSIYYIEIMSNTDHAQDLYNMNVIYPVWSEVQLYESVLIQ